MPVPEHWLVPKLHALVHTHCPPEHVMPEPHATALPQSVQPLGMVVHVWTPVPEHCVAPRVHRSPQPVPELDDEDDAVVETPELDDEVVVMAPPVPVPVLLLEAPPPVPELDDE